MSRTCKTELQPKMEVTGVPMPWTNQGWRKTPQFKPLGRLEGTRSNPLDQKGLQGVLLGGCSGEGLGQGSQETMDQMRSTWMMIPGSMPFSAEGWADIESAVLAVAG
jgi:hypothetical protein